MALNLLRTRELLKNFDFKTLFIEELGWDHCATRLPVTIDGAGFQLSAVAEKRGMLALVCNSLPPYALRRKIEQQVARSAHEHIIIYADTATGAQTWQWVKREPQKPAACREHTYHKKQPGDSLIQKLQSIAFTLEEEETITLVAVAGRARAAFDVDRVTKRFYERFKTEHDAFLKFIQGIPDDELQRWYASVMLNRLMFIYFIQKKGFLGKDRDYLKNRLGRSKDQGHDLFYKKLLCPLFFEGFAKKETGRSAAVNKLLGDVPYLNGGLFLKHQIEELHGKHIEIPDSAFEKLFAFFDSYQWHLDERPLRQDSEINPDVLGYIFEKYINQKQMGAYYTKEDITEYISKNTVIPFLFDAAKRECRIAFVGAGFALPASCDKQQGTGQPSCKQQGAASSAPTVWILLQTDPDRYIYEAVRRGVIDSGGNVIPESALPDFVQKGMRDPKARMFEKRYNLGEADLRDAEGNKLTLPTETWREYVERRTRCLALREKLKNGEVCDINDLITHNLDIRQFAQDVIWTCEGPELLRAFYHAIEKVTVLDPTCGSGAFLFAALNILEPLYEACLDRMQVFLNELDATERAQQAAPLQKKFRSDKYGDFRKILKRAAVHPNLKYFIYKSIIVNNLYGVDIMEEAVEICKLRLFLKLVAQIGTAEYIEPLPDIDFNIRAGNTLVGFATYEEVEKATEGDMLKQLALPAIREKAEDVDRLFQLFQKQQTEFDGEVTPEDKQELRRRLKALEDELNGYLATEYGVDCKGGSRTAQKYKQWLKSHMPFHWFIEFYGILKNGGFDVIIGNPPYVELKALSGYQPLGYSCYDAGNLYALIIERCFRLNPNAGYQGYIVPVSSVSTERYESLQRVLVTRPVHFSSFDDRPSRLFDGLEHIRLTIHIIGPALNKLNLFSNRYNKWLALERAALFSCLHYSQANKAPFSGTMPKLSSKIEAGIIQKLLEQGKRLATFYVRYSDHKVFYSRKVGYFLQVLNFEPLVLDGTGKRRPPSEFKDIAFGNTALASGALTCLNSNLFYWFITVFSDCRHINKREVDNFLVDLEDLTHRQEFRALSELAGGLMDDLQKNSEQKKMRFSHDTLTVQCIFPKQSKPIIDEIDCVLAKHYGFTDEELDFIINYDIKYRMGRVSEDEET
ncbi:MAG TPA: DNA methyltransferase [Dissulfurispiraceae bacterium]|nr:DNA methyltransferase [Dissulfurispiraceae bacterium]